MKSVVMLSDNARKMMTNNSSFGSVTIETKQVTFGLLDTKDINFDPEAPENKYNVLVKKKAFSCN